MSEIVEASDRLKNLKPYNPVELKIKPDTHVIGKTIAGLEFWQNTGATIIALRRGIHVSISPGPHVVLLENDVIVVVGDDAAHRKALQFLNMPL